MGRKRKARLDLPERVYFHHGAYYFVHATGRWENLGDDYAKAMARWSGILNTPLQRLDCYTVGELLDRYIREIVPHKAARTQKDNLGEIRFLRTFFGHMLATEVLPQHVAQYRDAREAKTRANREIALLSHVFSKACEWGICKTNPCREVKRNRETPRTRYITDDELESFKELCPPWLKAYIDIKALTALRQQDLLALRWSDVQDSCLCLTTLKTGKRLRIVLTPGLSSLMNSLPRRGVFCFMTRTDTRYSKSGFGSIWKRRMKTFVSNGHERFHEHDIRGKVATEMENAESAQKLLGHSSIKMTEDYIKARHTDVVQPLERKK